MTPCKNISVPPTEFLMTPVEINALLALPESKSVIDVLAAQGMRDIMLYDVYRLVHFPA